MRKIRLLLIPFTACATYWVATTSHAQTEFPPRPRPLPVLDEDGGRYRQADFERLLQQLKADRTARDSDWKALAKKKGFTPLPAEQEQYELQQMLRLTLERLQQSRKKPEPFLLPDHELPKKNNLPPLIEPKANPTEEKKADAPLPGNIDPTHLGNVLLRAGKYEEALASFRMIDLKTRKIEERPPLQILMATCLIYLGKYDEAIELLQSAANTRGDERFSGYAQWQLENQRWQRDVNDRLNDIRRRRTDVE